VRIKKHFKKQAALYCAMQQTRLTYFLIALALVCEALLLVVDVGLFYAQRARYLLSSALFFVKDFLAVGGFVALYLLIRGKLQRSAQTDSQLWIEPVDAFWRGFVFFGAIVIGVGVYAVVASKSDFDAAAASGILTSQSIYTLFKTHLITVFGGGVLLMSLVVMERMIFFRRVRNTQSNFLATIACLGAAAFSMAGSQPGEFLNFPAIAFLALAVILMLINSFRLSWVLPMSRNDKIRSLFMVLGLLGELAIFIGIQHGAQHLFAYSGVTGTFFLATTAFVLLYLITTFFSILSYLPTSEALEKKSAEVRNLYAMSKFVADVFDEEKIYESLVGYACESVGASTIAWFDVYQPHTDDGKTLDNNTAARLPNVQWRDKRGYFKTVAQQNISEAAIHAFSQKAAFVWEEMLARPQLVRIDDVETDKRLSKTNSPVKAFIKRLGTKVSRENMSVASLVAVPLMARTQLLGILLVAKDVEYGIVKDDLELINTFAEQAAIAIQNSRLIREVIDKERLQQELLVAQKIQLRLLPQSPLIVAGFDMDGVSYPAYEVGGDFYDFCGLNDGEPITKFGIIVADVSGKGTSAAFYMAELKGVFQSLCRIYPDAPKELLKRANETLARGMEKSSFISAIYATADAETDTLTVSNAGHCPMVFVSETEHKIVRLKGLALGLDKGAKFNQIVSEERLPFKRGDTVVFYTDGVIEAVNANDEEFGTKRLVETVAAAKRQSASEIKAAVFNAVNAFTGDGGAVRDDLTIVVLKRC
jgi:phosphoserine phosphatase RsbU/P